MKSTPEIRGPVLKPAALAIIAAATIAYLVAILFTPSWLIGTPEYHWPVLRHAMTSMFPAAALVLVLAGALALMLAEDADAILRAPWGRSRLYLCLLGLGLVFQLGPFAMHKMGLVEFPLRVYLPDHTSYFTDAAKIQDLDSWLSGYPREVPELATHSRTHPPGAILVFYAAQKFMEGHPRLSAAIVSALPRSEEAERAFSLTPAQTAAGPVMAALLLLMAAASVPLTFALARLFFTEDEGENRTANQDPFANGSTNVQAVLAAALFAAAPAFSAKTPVLDHALGVMALLALWLTVSGVRLRKIERIVAGGGVIGFGLWLGLTLLAALPLCVLYSCAAIWKFRREGAPFRRCLVLETAVTVLLAGTASAVVLLPGAALNVSWIEIYRAITQIGWRMNNELSGRVHAWMWIAFNSYEIMAFAGAPLAALFIMSAVGLFPKLRSRRFKDLDPWLLALVVFLVLLDASGKVCYEASRLAWFSFPLIAIAASRSAPLPGPGRMAAPAMIMALEIASVIVFRLVF